MSGRGLELAGGFYEEIVAPLLARLAPTISYSAALIGPGSEVLGYDDETSTDHDWGPRVLIFLGDADAQAAGPRLTEALADRLPEDYRGLATRFGPPRGADTHVSHRIEILSLDEWLGGYVGLEAASDGTPRAEGAALDELDWLTLPGQKLLSITAGAVFRDDGNRLATLRRALSWYPDDVWRYLMASVWTRLAQEEHLVGRAGQSGDETGARIIASRLVRDMMRLCFLAERRYAPYPKWFGRAFSRLGAAATFGPLFERILNAGHWRDRDAAFIPAWEELARIHNTLGLTEPMPQTVQGFFGRPFHVMAIQGFSEALLNTIHAPWLSPAMRASPLGGIDLISDNTDLLENASYRPALRGICGAERRR